MTRTLEKGAGALLLVAGKLTADFIEPVRACRAAVAEPRGDDEGMRLAVTKLSVSLY